MATDAAKQHRQAPPGYINAHNYAVSRASELESLHSLICNRLNNDFRSRRSKRRRTTSFASKKHPHQVRWSDDKQEKKVSRRVRRRVELKRNGELGFSVSGDGTKRLTTHVWLAKRFSITKLWGFYLPIALHGSGRGSRALLKWTEQGALVHDASFYSVAQLKGSQAIIFSPSPLFSLPSFLPSLIYHPHYLAAIVALSFVPITASFPTPLFSTLTSWRFFCNCHGWFTFIFYSLALLYLILPFRPSFFCLFCSFISLDKVALSQFALSPICGDPSITRKMARAMKEIMQM